MKNFKGFDDWIEVFRIGTHTDSAGNVKDWTEGDLQKISENYNPGKNEAPVVIGHPEDNAPAYGWVAKAKTEGGVLWAKFKDVVPEFADMVKKGMFKKRSISLSPDLALRHVGFLGAMPPAVKGLTDLKFSDDKDTITFEFNAEKHKSAKARKGGKTMTFKEFMEMFKFWKEAEKNPEMQLPDGSNQGGQGTPSSKDKSFTEADIEAAKKTGAEAERKKAETEFAEKERTVKREARTKEISDFCEALVKDGKIPPSWVDSGLVEFVKHLDSETEISFSEKGDKKSPTDWFKNFLEGLEKSSIFQELATKEKAGDSADFAEAKKAQEVGESIAAKVN